MEEIRIIDRYFFFLQLITMVIVTVQLARTKQLLKVVKQLSKHGE